MNRFFVILRMLLILSPALVQAQEHPTAEVVGDLPTEMAGTSTLFFHDGNLWSCNDHGTLVLYALDTLRADITDSIVLAGSVYDLEEVTQDEEYLYFGDMGDNNGVRNDLHVLRQEKAALALGTIAFDTLWFSYPDRADSNARDFDCESFVVTDTALIFFTKQWLSQGSSCYSIPKTPGRWEARRLFDIATEGMVTGASYQPERGRLVLCGYNILCMPFVYLFDGFSGDDFVSGRQTRVELTNGIGWQTEGIATTDGHHYYLTCEHLETYGITHPAQLLTLDLSAFLGNTTQIPSHPVSQPLTIYPNPTTGVIYLPSQGVKEVTIVDMQGHVVLTQTIKQSSNQAFIDISMLPTGTYVLRVIHEDGRERGEVMMVNR